jgi:hypothetical protein
LLPVAYQVAPFVFAVGCAGAEIGMHFCHWDHSLSSLSTCLGVKSLKS